MNPIVSSLTIERHKHQYQFLPPPFEDNHKHCSSNIDLVDQFYSISEIPLQLVKTIEERLQIIIEDASLKPVVLQ